MENKYNVMGIIGLVALRKSELYYKVVSELSKKKQVSEDEQKAIKEYISEMNNEMFLTKSEKEDKNINSRLKLRDLDVDVEKIIKEVRRNI